MTKEPLAEESRTFEANRARWAEEHDGKFVLIRGTEIVGFYATNEQALSEGYTRFGIASFFVKQVSQPGHAHFVSRLVVPMSVS